MAFTLLGVVALVLREWNVNNNTLSDGRDEEDPGARSSDGQVSDDQSADLFHGCDEIPQTPVSATSKGAQTSVCATSKGTQTSVSATSKGAQTPVSATSKGAQTPVSATSKGTQTPVSATSKGTQTSVCATSKGTDEVPQTSVCATSKVVGVVQSSQQQQQKTIIDINSSMYEIDFKLGERGFGRVFAATRLEDGVEVVIKIVSNEEARFIDLGGYLVPMEVALQILANEEPRVDEIVQILDWVVKTDYYYMVLERFTPCQEVIKFLQEQIINEDTIRKIMHQVIVAAQVCCERRVFYRDIKVQNILINPETLKIKLIDFGCGEFLHDTAYTSYYGTPQYCPPEYLNTGTYHGKPATVWSLGILMFFLLFGRFPTYWERQRIDNETQAIEILSKECVHFLCCCLKIHPDQRLELEKLTLHDWFKDIAEVPQPAVCATTNENNVPQDPVFDTTEINNECLLCSLDIDEVPQTVVCAITSENNVPQTPVFDTTQIINECLLPSKNINEVPQTAVCATTSESDNVPQPPVSDTTENSNKSGPQVFNDSSTPSDDRLRTIILSFLCILCILLSILLLAKVVNLVL